MKSRAVTHKGAGHRQRLRERFMAAGLDGFHDYEVIELLLTLATPRKDCKQAAKQALERFDSLPDVLEASQAQLCEIDGLGPRNIFGLKLIKAVAERYLIKKLEQRDPLNNSRDLFDYLYSRIRDKQQEHFEVVYLDAKNRVLTSQTLFRGTLTASSVYPREVVRAALDHKAAALIFAHNHPSGDPTPSAEDRVITRRLVFACRLVDIVVHEHIVIGRSGYFSFADQGLIRQFVQEFETTMA